MISPFNQPPTIYRAECEVCGDDLEDTRPFASDEPTRCCQSYCIEAERCDACGEWEDDRADHECADDEPNPIGCRLALAMFLLIPIIC